MTSSLTESRIFQLNAERASIVSEVVSRVMGERARSESALELALNDTAYHEVARLEGDARRESQLRQWTELYRTLGRRDRAEKERLLRELVSQYAWDIVGNFDPRVYRLATRMVPKGLSLLFKSQLGGNPAGLRERLTIQGRTDMLQALVERGTVILVPTHSSNLDSIVVGFVLHELGLPPFTYGAGKNLFTNPVLSYFMHHLGAYKVDRRLRHGLYKNTLKTYSAVILERGYHSLFFPGGGRARSGAVEKKLKLGLLGTGLEAYIDNLRANKAKPNVYIVPMTINYPITLEAATLIDDYLQEVGRSRYIIEDDESARLGRIWRYARDILDFDARMFLQIGQPLDPFGNLVDAEGRSLDKRGRLIDLRRYVEVDGEPAHVRDRDAEYTRELGESIVEAFYRNNVALATTVVAFALFELLQARHSDLDIYHLVRLPADTGLSQAEALAAIAKLRDRLVIAASAGQIQLSPTIQSESPERILEVALRYFSMYHDPHLVTRDGERLIYGDVKLLYYYRNRLTGYDFERVFAPEHAPREVSVG